MTEREIEGLFQVHFIRNGETVRVYQRVAATNAAFRAEVEGIRVAESGETWDDVRIELPDSERFLWTDTDREKA